MSLTRKLKPDRAITGILIPLTMFVIIGLGAFFLGLKTGIIIGAVEIWVYALYNILVYVRTRNFPHLFSCLFQVFLGGFYYAFTFYIGVDRIETLESVLAAVSLMIFFLGLLIYFAVTRKMKWRGREVFELAGESVEADSNGYTSRPRPVGKLEFSQQEIDAFSRFAAKNLIALPYRTSRNLTLVPIKMGDEYGRILGLSGDFRDATWINFEANGEVSVHISRKDYLDYREPLAFDQLCVSLGQVFIDFFELYKKGEGVRVIDRMDELKIPYYS